MAEFWPNLACIFIVVSIFLGVLLLVYGMLRLIYRHQPEPSRPGMYQGRGRNGG